MGDLRVTKDSEANRKFLNSLWVTYSTDWGTSLGSPPLSTPYS
eukprot:CAMPEP_0168617444 /NCGR_PEP_ID=MMETSP0449_2-20121227/5544_1 /TAXON_ID=1082188 /ORGANISM="Strombidium rassoulzadegani, Strain ras09" /LENGTH=42 /DNA_ID= /DNA_START= /DNA_END= /DNA_ORIENTATION=